MTDKALDKQYMALALRLAAEYSLTPICVRRPLVEHDHAREIFEIRDLLQQAFRQVVEQLAFNRICRVCGSQVQTCFERSSQACYVHAKIVRGEENHFADERL